MRGKRGEVHETDDFYKKERLYRHSEEASGDSPQHLASPGRRKSSDSGKLYRQRAGVELSETIRENSGALLPENHASVNSISNSVIKKAVSTSADTAFLQISSRTQPRRRCERRFFSLGFSKCLLLRSSLRVPSLSSFFLRRRRALSIGSPFFMRISVASIVFTPFRDRYLFLIYSFAKPASSTSRSRSLLNA